LDENIFKKKERNCDFPCASNTEKYFRLKNFS
jgi:hypothetical protein